MHRNVRYPLAKFKDCMDNEGRKVMAFTIRTTDGKDEAWAAKRAEATGQTMTEELICFSLISIEVQREDKSTEIIEIKHPYTGFEEWSTKLRNFVVAAWRRLATPDEEELASFFEGASEE